jgi:hypothetical protein
MVDLPKIVTIRKYSNPTQLAFDKFYTELKEIQELQGLIAAVVWVGKVGITHYDTGTKVELYTPNIHVAQKLSEYILHLYERLDQVFNLRRLVICTIDDPFYPIPAREWSYLTELTIRGKYTLIAGTDTHPAWCILGVLHPVDDRVQYTESDTKNFRKLGLIL